MNNIVMNAVAMWSCKRFCLKRRYLERERKDAEKQDERECRVSCRKAEQKKRKSDVDMSYS